MTDLIYIPDTATETEAISILTSRLADIAKDENLTDKARSAALVSILKLYRCKMYDRLLKHDANATAALLNLTVVIEELAYRQGGMMEYDLGVLVGQAKIALGINS